MAANDCYYLSILMESDSERHLKEVKVQMALVFSNNVALINILPELWGFIIGKWSVALTAVTFCDKMSKCFQSLSFFAHTTQINISDGNMRHIGGRRCRSPFCQITDWKSPRLLFSAAVFHRNRESTIWTFVWLEWEETICPHSC